MSIACQPCLSKRDPCGPHRCSRASRGSCNGNHIPPDSGADASRCNAGRWVDALHAALEDRVVALNRVGVNVATDVFERRMAHRTMLGNSLPSAYWLASSVMNRLSRRMFVRTIGTTSEIAKLSMWKLRAPPPRSTRVSTGSLEVRISQGPKGPQVAEVIDVDASTAQVPSRAERGPAHRSSSQRAGLSWFGQMVQRRERVRLRSAGSWWQGRLRSCHDPRSERVERAARGSARADANQSGSERARSSVNRAPGLRGPNQPR
jgi:hypothetical protein